MQQRKTAAPCKQKTLPPLQTNDSSRAVRDRWRKICPWLTLQVKLGACTVSTLSLSAHLCLISRGVWWVRTHHPGTQATMGHLGYHSFPFPVSLDPFINLKERMNSWDYQGTDFLVLSPHGSVVKECVWHESAGWNTQFRIGHEKNSEFWRY